MAETCRMTLAALELTPGGYEIRTRHEALRIEFSIHGSAFRLRFPGRWRDVAKGKLVKKLLRKHFEPIVPRPRINLRRARSTA